MNYTTLTMIVAMLLIGSLVGCTPEGNTIKIGYIGPLTGDVAVLGTDASNAIKLAVDQANTQGGINGKQIELFIEDDQYDTAKTLIAYNKLVQHNDVDVIMLSTYGGLFAIADLAAKEGVLVVDVLDCDTQIANDLPDNVFCIAKETKDLADVIADYAVQQGYQHVGILHGTADPFMPSVAAMFKERAASLNVQVESYPVGTKDFKTELTKLKDNDALVFLGYDEIGLAIRQAKQVGYDVPYLSIPSVATTPSIVEASQETIDGMYFSFYAPLDDNPAVQQFYADYEAAYERKPYVFVASDHAYDAANILINTVLGKEGIDAKKQALYGVAGYPGVSGNLCMGADGRINGIKIRLYQLQDLAPVYVQG